MRESGLRIGIWLLAGTIVACFWVVFAMLAGPGRFDSYSTAIAITVPASLIWPTGPVTWYTVMFVNTAIYGLIGLALEPLLRLRRQPR